MDILVSEVGPRDGLQSIKRAMPTAVKHRWIRALADAGLREIEVASFVPPKLLPQMADAAEVVREAVKIPGITVLALVPNLRGFQDAVAAGAPKVTLTVSASEAHSLSNIRMTCAQAIESAQRIVVFRDSLPKERQPLIEVGVSTAFGCTLQGAVDEDFAISMAVKCAEAGADSVGLSDSVGYANPAQIDAILDGTVRGSQVAKDEARPLIVVGVGQTCLGDVDRQAQARGTAQSAIQTGRVDLAIGLTLETDFALEHIRRRVASAEQQPRLAHVEGHPLACVVVQPEEIARFT